ncbi:Fur-regulated basic protein FbpA [Bacillus massiliglaciei]|uniref:Fur-regulated basic protein FbpA n=1 Tax=Bacillus massiliglaciei TaxID=1816693 RepID=UPI000DA63212|nr:Fur-regulated basic protein FbpA [Bacillus massiliglaciei]
MTHLRNAVTRRKEELIQQLLDLGIYKKDDHHLYELTLTEIEKEYIKVREKIKSTG